MSPLDALSPDQRAVIQLVLQQERSYEDLAGLLGIAVEGVRARAVAGLQALVPDDELSADHREFITDFLLGQLSVSERESARRFLSSTPEARDWALDVADELGDLGEDALPEIPDLDASIATPAEVPPLPEAPPAQTETMAGLGRPVDREPVDFFAEDDDEEADDEPAVRTPARPEPAARPRPRPRPQGAVTPAGADARPRSSKLGGALLIAGLAIVVAAVLIKVLSDGDDGGGGDRVANTQTPTQTASAQPRQLFAVPLEAVGDSGATGTMAIFQQEQQVFFTLQAEKVPANQNDEAYAIWLIGGGKSRRLGYFQEPVGEGGTLGTTGPSAEDIPKFPKWLTTYKRVVVSRETRQNASQPGPIVLQGVLPAAGA